MTIGIGTDRGINAGAPIYVSDLPGHDGLVISATNPKSDWGWSTRREKAIALTDYWQKRFAKYSREGFGFNGRLVEVPSEVYCVECGAETELDCVCDDLNFADSRDCGAHNSI